MQRWCCVGLVVAFVLVVFVFCCSLVSVVLCGLLFIIQDLPQRVGFSVTLMLYSDFSLPGSLQTDCL